MFGHRPFKKKNIIDVSNIIKDVMKDAIRIGHKSSNFLHTDNGLEFKIKNLLH